ncbi:hypothetical protein [Nocardioides convexus]|uniref:hypothetical protein n=1 Tax=Nocardioides convexus TaxID=2712224 RepID=UPI0024183914|nr:hypothetical protein [Nocardioides convexus]
MAAQIGDGSHGEGVTTEWTPRLADLFGPERAASIQASTWWPALVAKVDHGVERGWQVEALLGAGRAMPSDGWEGVDECQALVWRTSIALESAPDEHAHEYHFDEPPADLWDGVEPDPATVVDHPMDTATAPDWADWPLAEDPGPYDEHLVDAFEEDLVDVDAGDPVDVDEDQFVEPDLTLAAYIRDLGGTRLEPTEADLRLMYQRAEEWHSSPVSRERMLEINDMTQAFFEARFQSSSGSWGRDYLTGRFGVDLAGDERFRPGQAPAGWTNLVGHLRSRDVSDAEMVATGVASEASTGRLIDRFRDRVMFPVIHHNNGQREVLGFVGRRRPGLTDADKGGPKYLNTADTPLFHKGAQLVRRRRRSARRGRGPGDRRGPDGRCRGHAGQPWALPRCGTARYVADRRAGRPGWQRWDATRSWPPTPTSPARSRPSGTSGCSPRTAWTLATPGSPTAWTRPTCSHSAGRQRSRPRWPAASRPSARWATNCSPSG